MTLQADLAKLGAMADTLHGYGDEAAGLNGIEGVPPVLLLPSWIHWGATLQSVSEAAKMALNVQDVLIPAVSARLREIGDLMHECTVEFRKADDSSATALAETITRASGDWQAPR
ncbi:hypothetical protein ACW9HQ_38305 [Nocardia gipuzkoensis]